MPDVDSATEHDEDAPRALRSHMQDTFSPAGVAVAADGGPVIPHSSELVVLDNANWICLHGPCRNYHRLVKTVDAQKALDGSKTYGDGSPIRDAEETIHTCYPAPGREMDLGDVQILECNRWDPLDPNDEAQRDLERRRADYRGRAEREQERARGDAAEAFLVLLAQAVIAHPDAGTFEISPAALELLVVTEAYLEIGGSRKVAPDHLCATVASRTICINAEASLVDDEIRPYRESTAAHATGLVNNLSPETLAAISAAGPGGAVDIVHDGAQWVPADDQKRVVVPDPHRKR